MKSKIFQAKIDLPNENFKSENYLNDLINKQDISVICDDYKHSDLIEFSNKRNDEIPKNKPQTFYVKTQDNDKGHNLIEDFKESMNILLPEKPENKKIQAVDEELWVNMQNRSLESNFNGFSYENSNELILEQRRLFHDDQLQEDKKQYNDKHDDQMVIIKIDNRIEKASFSSIKEVNPDGKNEYNESIDYQEENNNKSKELFIDSILYSSVNQHSDYDKDHKYEFAIALDFDKDKKIYSFERNLRNNNYSNTKTPINDHILKGQIEHFNVDDRQIANQNHEFDGKNMFESYNDHIIGNPHFSQPLHRLNQLSYDTEFNDAKDDNLSEENEHEYINSNEQHYIINYAKDDSKTFNKYQKTEFNDDLAHSQKNVYSSFQLKQNKILKKMAYNNEVDIEDNFKPNYLNHTNEISKDIMGKLQKLLEVSNFIETTEDAKEKELRFRADLQNSVNNNQSEEKSNTFHTAQEIPSLLEIGKISDVDLNLTYQYSQ